ncbi:hypothetical protein ACSU1N_05240 [Thermogladius sp. 4427co]|uniref:hypothetical protein n=1 Tax=Thermogladius sp. 4427co TaxID=3450718 RepID=UPI003F7A3E78
MAGLIDLIDEAIKLLNSVSKGIDDNIMSRSKEVDARIISVAANLNSSFKEIASFLTGLRDKASKISQEASGLVLSENTYLTNYGDRFILIKIKPRHAIVSYDRASSSFLVEVGSNKIIIGGSRIEVKSKGVNIVFNPSQLEEYESRFSELKLASRIIQNNISECVSILAQKIR